MPSGERAPSAASELGTDAFRFDLPIPLVVMTGPCISRANPAAAELLEADADALIGARLTDHLECVAPEEATRTATDPAMFVTRGDPVRWIEAFATWTIEPPDSSTDRSTHQPTNDDASGATTVIALRDATDDVRMKRIARELTTSASVVGDHGQRLWGPIGREIPLDGTELPGSVVDRIHPEDLSRVLDLYTQILADPGGRASAEIRIQDPWLQGRWTNATVQLADYRAVPEVNGILVSTEHAVSDVEIESIGRTEGSFLSIAEGAPVGIVLTGPTGQSAYFNEAVKRLLPGIGPGDLERDWTRDARDEDRSELRAMNRRVRETREGESRVACFRPPEGDDRWLLVTIAPRIVEDDRLIGLVVTLQDVSAEVVMRQQLEAAQGRLVHAATHDSLTGLANRLELAEQLRDRLEVVPSIDAGDDRRLGVLFCDLDGFKAVNDSFGHAFGDALLAQVAERLRTVARSQDTLARFGGDEFILLAECDGDDGLMALGDRAVAAIGRPYDVDGEEVVIEVSVGGTMARPGDSGDDLLRRADDAMYAAKAAGKNCVRVI